MVKKAEDEAITDLSMVEWLHDDNLDARSDFFSSSIWEFPDGEGKAGKLRPECCSRRMFRYLPDLDAPGEEMKPKPGFDFWRFFQNLFRIHEGEVSAIGDTDWVRWEGWPPMDKSFWHCQYVPSGESYTKAMEFGCRGAPRMSKSPGKVNWKESSPLTAQQVLAIGSTSICIIDSTLATKWEKEDASSRWSETEDASSSHHYRRGGTMVSYMRFLVFLLNEQQWGISMYTAESIWKSREKICQARVRWSRGGREQDPKGKGKGGPKGKRSGKGKK